MPRKRNGCPTRRSPILPVGTCNVATVDDADISSCSFPSRCLTPRVFEIFARKILSEARSQSQARDVQTLASFFEDGGRYFPTVIFVPVYCPRKNVMALAEVTGLRRRGASVHIALYVPTRGAYVSPRRAKKVIIRSVKDTIEHLQRRGDLVSVAAGALSRLKRVDFQILRLPIAKDVESSFFALKRMQQRSYNIDCNGRGAYSKYEVQRLRRFLVCNLFESLITLVS